MNEVAQIIAKRDNITFESAVTTLEEIREIIMAMIEDGFTIDEIEDVWLNATGLELDYMMQVIYH